jgi:hypothetical protein
MTNTQSLIFRDAQSFGLHPRHIGGSYVLIGGVCRSFEELAGDVARYRRIRAQRLARTAR